MYHFFTYCAVKISQLHTTRLRTRSPTIDSHLVLILDGICAALWIHNHSMYYIIDIVRMWSIWFLTKHPMRFKINGIPQALGQTPPQSTPFSSWFCIPSQQVSNLINIIDCKMDQSTHTSIVLLLTYHRY